MCSVLVYLNPGFKGGWRVMLTLTVLAVKLLTSGRGGGLLWWRDVAMAVAQGRWGLTLFSEAGHGHEATCVA